MLIFIVVWAVLSFGYGVIALAAAGNLFGREANGNHLASLAVAFAAWGVLTVAAVRAARAFINSDSIHLSTAF